jgi:hypothetical protein
MPAIDSDPGVLLTAVGRRPVHRVGVRVLSDEWAFSPERWSGRGGRRGTRHEARAASVLRVLTEREQRVSSLELFFDLV